MATIRAKAILPKKFDAKTMMAELAKEMQAVSKDVEKDFHATAKTWNNKPGFSNQHQQTARQLRFEVATQDKVYSYVSGGTKAHIIRPKKAKVLAFPGTYRAKTSPGVIGSSGGGSSGPTVYSRGVKHPGTKARKFDEEISKKWDKPFKSRMEQAMKRAKRKSGHGL